jgi:hypothetical protein
MNAKDSLRRLTALSELILDTRLAKLKASAAERNKSMQRLENLAATLSDDANDLTHAATILRYERWADARRREINLVLARQTAVWLEARQNAQTAFGRAEVLKKIQATLNKR